MRQNKHKHQWELVDRVYGEKIGLEIYRCTHPHCEAERVETLQRAEPEQW